MSASLMYNWKSLYENLCMYCNTVEVACVLRTGCRSNFGRETARQSEQIKLRHLPFVEVARLTKVQEFH